MALEKNLRWFGPDDLYALVEALVKEQKNRINSGRKDHMLPIRPDHEIKLLDDFNRKAHPGYPLIGRMKGLAELSGLEAGVMRGSDAGVTPNN